MSKPGASIMQRMASGRRSLGFGKKKEKNKNFQDDPTDATKTLATEQEHDKEVVKEEIEEVEEEEELDEAYTLPEIPHTPISGTDCVFVHPGSALSVGVKNVQSNPIQPRWPFAFKKNKVFPGQWTS